MPLPLRLLKYFTSKNALHEFAAVTAGAGLEAQFIPGPVEGVPEPTNGEAAIA